MSDEHVRKLASVRVTVVQVRRALDNFTTAEFFPLCRNNINNDGGCGVPRYAGEEHQECRRRRYFKPRRVETNTSRVILSSFLLFLHRPMTFCFLVSFISYLFSCTLVLPPNLVAATTTWMTRKSSHFSKL